MSLNCGIFWDVIWELPVTAGGETLVDGSSSRTPIYLKDSGKLNPFLLGKARQRYKYQRLFLFYLVWPT